MYFLPFFDFIRLQFITSLYRNSSWDLRAHLIKLTNSSSFCMIQFWSLQIHRKRKYLIQKTTGFLGFPSCYHWKLSTWIFSSHIFFFPLIAASCSLLSHLACFEAKTKVKIQNIPPTDIGYVRKKMDEENGCCTVVYFSAVCGFHKK